MTGSVLVTGGAGYIGSHAALALLDAGWRVTVVDDLSTGRRELVPIGARLVRADAGDLARMTGLLREIDCTAVMHFAGSTVVPDSVRNPLAYYRNNSMASLSLIDAATRWGVRAFIFSSTAAVYGNPKRLPVDEECEPRPISPYGVSKLVVERVLEDTGRAHGLPWMALRYFNVAGADPLGRSGQSTPEATHLIKVACEVACGRRERLTIHGDDYDTPDGTCVRDFIHVTDLAAAHVAALEYLLSGGAPQVLDCGYGRGISVREVIDTIGRLAGRPLPVVVGPRRAGDIVAMVASGAKLRRVLGWQPRHDGLDAIMGSALAWEIRQTSTWRAPRPTSVAGPYSPEPHPSPG
ncbi:MAG: UDP-glucose 4-epimerase GalE [Alphaproteobacteria bacterium]|nr:UDP-glucose 4-epimerase GalE [Alphaproteobacteria bacterium]